MHQCRYLGVDLLAAALDAPASRVAPWVDPLNFSFNHANLLTDERLAFYLAQIGHETGGLRWLEELWGPTSAQKRYEGRTDLGNTSPGDGYRFRGRGLIHTTGRYNYQVLTGRLEAPHSPDFERAPDLLSAPKWAAVSAADYWNRLRLNRFADSGDFLGLTKAVNGGTNGLTDRERRLKLARAALS